MFIDKFYSLDNWNTAINSICESISTYHWCEWNLTSSVLASLDGFGLWAIDVYFSCTDVFFGFQGITNKGPFEPALVVSEEARVSLLLPFPFNK